MATLDFDTLHPEGEIALALSDSGIRREALAYIAYKLREAGYTSDVMRPGLPEAVQRMKQDFRACWPSDDEANQPKPGTFQHYQLRKELEAHAAKRLGRA